MLTPPVALSALCALAVVASSQQPKSNDSPSPAATAAAVRATVPPSIDGRDDDAVWQSAPRVADFLQFQPRIDSAPSLKTEFRAAYDDRNLYVFVRMFDPHPDSIMHALTRRDVRGPSDQIKLLIDSYYDKRTGFEFAVNPDGVKRDYSMSNDGNEDDSWNGIWDVATRVVRSDGPPSSVFRSPSSATRSHRRTYLALASGVTSSVTMSARRGRATSRLATGSSRSSAN